MNDALTIFKRLTEKLINADGQLIIYAPVTQEEIDLIKKELSHERV